MQEQVLRLGAAATLLLATGSALAQTTPQRTTATYEDWTVRCEMRGTPPVKFCEMVQAVTAPGQSNPVTQIAIGRASPKDAVKMVFQLPVNVWIATGVKFNYDPRVPPLAAPLRWCAPAGCFADLELKDDMVKRLRALTTVQGRFEFKDAGQRDVAIPVSFKGFGLAFDALTKE